MKRTSFLGFSMVEMLVILAIIVGLAGVVVPIVSQEVQDSRRAAAMDDLNRLATGLNQYIKDTLFYPTGKEGAARYDYLYTNGPLPSTGDFVHGKGIHVEAFLNKPDFGGARWKGPYLQGVTTDPWGHAYVVNVRGFFDAGERAMILSAGPNGVVETSPRASQPGGDDLMLLFD